MMTGIQYRIIVAGSVPIVLGVIGILGKRLTRGTAGSWKRSDFYLAGELCLAGISAAAISLCDLLLKPAEQSLGPQMASISNGAAQAAIDTKLVGINFGVVFLGMVVFMFVVILFQDYVREANVDAARKKEIWMLAGLGNGLGVLVLLAAVLSLPV
jgi:hypothetical protein